METDDHKDPPHPPHPPQPPPPPLVLVALLTSVVVVVVVVVLLEQTSPSLVEIGATAFTGASFSALLEGSTAMVSSEGLLVSGEVLMVSLEGSLGGGSGGTSEESGGHWGELGDFSSSVVGGSVELILGTNWSGSFFSSCARSSLEGSWIQGSSLSLFFVTELLPAATGLEVFKLSDSFASSLGNRS